MKQIKACAVALTIQATLLVGGNHLYAAAQLSLSDGSTTVIVVDGGPGDANVEAGVITFIGAVGPNWFFNATAGVTKPIVGSPAAPYMDVGTTSLSLQAGQLTIEFTDTDFTASGTGTASVGATVPPGGTISYNVWLDAGNNPFAKTTPLTTIGPLGGAPSGTATADVGVGPYSLTLQTIINHTGAGQTHVDAEFRVIPSRSCDCELTLTPPADLSLCGEANLPDGNQVAAGLTVTDSCGVIAQVQFLGDEIVSGSCPKIIKRTFAAIDSCRNLRTAIQTITVTNTAAPVFTQCPPDLNLGCNPASIPDCDLTQVAATNNCGTAATIICDQVDVQDGCSFTRTITYTATNDCGNSATCVQKITWKQDIKAPVFTKCPQDLNLGCNPASIPDCNHQAQEVEATDDCGGRTILCATSVDSANGCARTRRITYTATDDCGNQSTCVQTITWVEDSAKPVVTVPTGGNLGCNPASTPTDASVRAQVSATDNCSVANISVTHVDASSGCSITRTFTVTATDPCGNVSLPKTITYTWKVDTTKPSITCPANLILCENDPIPAPDTSKVTASDSCGSVIVSYVGAVTNGTCPKVITRTYKATDECGNFDTCTQTITVNCNPPCTLTAPNPLPVMDTSGNTLCAPAGNFTYAWTIVASAGWEINGPTNTQCITYSAGSSGTATFQVVVTDKATGCKSTCSVTFGLASGGATPGFWGNKNGLSRITAADFTALNGLCLRNGVGANRDFTQNKLDDKKAAFDLWLKDRNAINMSYQLSAHLAAFTLNCRHSYICSNAVVSVPGCGGSMTAAALIKKANDALCADGSTFSGDANRAMQECLKNALALMNNSTTTTAKTCP